MELYVYHHRNCISEYIFILCYLNQIMANQSIRNCEYCACTIVEAFKAVLFISDLDRLQFCVLWATCTCIIMLCAICMCNVI